MSEKARKYAIVNDFDEPMSLKDGTTVLQFENRLQNGLESGGAYLKYLLPQEAGWKPKEFDNESLYSIMFGPEKCGATNKAHYILKHKNIKNGEYVEHILNIHFLSYADHAHVRPHYFASSNGPRLYGHLKLQPMHNSRVHASLFLFVAQLFPSFQHHHLQKMWESRKS